uniref:Uncharacterized protein n=1 Tax=Panagrolaimus sp. JU765 TaxID=591449 RepID=A0AC34RKC7_9BILA
MEENLEKIRLTTNIWSEFEHDRSEFVIKFPYLFQDERAQPPVEELRIIMFCFKYESFQRLVVSRTKDSEKCLFIGVKYPPKIFSVYKRKLPNKKEKWSSSRRTTWGRKEESGVRRRNIADATTIMLTFDEYK